MKKRITSELLHIALVITLLRGDPRRLVLNENVLSTNFFNDVYDLDHAEGPNWAHTRANYHRLLIDPGLEDTKSLNSYFNPDENIFDSNYNDDFDEEAAERLYRQQARLLVLSRLNSPYRTRKDAPPAGFQDITAYLVSDTTSSLQSNTVAGIMEARSPPTPVVGSSGGVASFAETSPPPSVDSGHEGFCSDTGSNRASESEGESNPSTPLAVALAENNSVSVEVGNLEQSSITDAAQERKDDRSEDEENEAFSAQLNEDLNLNANFEVS
jgi:hypothetical protein